MKEIDYTKLNEQIVKQAYDSARRYILTEAETRKLINDKFERAKQFSEALKNSPVI